ncbi:MAG: alpha/beta fold hydrolase [Proteobacteria bacterium]|nr:alpha/beta fold hydrolase [Pseudomonadota bacterium]
MSSAAGLDCPLLPHLRATDRIQFADWGGGRMCWRRFGDAGAPLVLLHGGHGSWLHWARNVEALSARWTVWVPDLPGYGESDDPPVASMEGLLDATLRALDLLIPRARQLRLVGFSFGALVAAHVAARRGAVSHLGLLGPAGHGGPLRPRGSLVAWRALAPGSDEWKEAMRHNLLMHMLHQPEQVDEVALHIHGQACLGTRFHSKTISRTGALHGPLDQHRGELLMAWGAHDVTLDPGFVASSASGLPSRCRMQEVAGAGHWVQFEAAKTVNDLLFNWLERDDAEADYVGWPT